MSEKRNTEEISDVSVKKSKLSLQPTSNSGGIALIKKEFIVDETLIEIDDDVAEQADKQKVIEEAEAGESKDKKKRKRGQNKKRDLIQPKDKIQLCNCYLDPQNIKPCPYGEKCNKSHDIEEYLKAKLPDVEETPCPQFTRFGKCSGGIKCRWLKTHFNFELKELIVDNEKHEKVSKTDYEVNKVSQEQKFALHGSKKKRESLFSFRKSDEIVTYLDKIAKTNSKYNNNNKQEREDQEVDLENRKDSQFDYVEAPFKPWEKKKIDYSRTKVVSPLTTVGNLPFRQTMKQIYDVNTTFSEMALATPLIQGQNSEWALMKAHSSEIPGFGAQIAGSKHWQVVKACELIKQYTPTLSEINLNCGCPIDLLYKQGAGSGLLEQPSRTLRMLKGMNLITDDIPITVKLRMGTKDNSPMAESLVKKLLYSNSNGVPDVSAITLHGRSRQQRYTRQADWDYVSKVGKIIEEFNEKQKENKDSYDMPNKVFFIANGDVYNHEDFNKLVDFENTGIDTCMIARGALIKPWLFEEIDKGQYLDKSSTERLEVIKQFANNAINHWGSDEYGINVSRRYLCEWLSFTHRYIPVGLLEKLPHQINERPPKWKGRNDLETLLGSNDYKDWIKITELFLGPAHPDFKFIPKHKSNAF